MQCYLSLCLYINFVILASCVILLLSFLLAPFVTKNNGNGKLLIVKDWK